MRIVSMIDAISGGGGMVMYNIIKGLPQHDHLIICPSEIPSWSIGLPKLIKDLKVPIFSAYAKHERPAMKLIEEKVASFKPHIILNHWWRSSRIQRLNKFGKTRGIYGRTKTILVSHNNDPSPPGYDYYVSVSKYNSKFQVNANKERKGQKPNQRVIYNGIDIDRFNVPKNVLPGKFVIGRVSSLVKFKIPRDWVPFVGTWKIPNLLHIVVGDGERKRQFEYDLNKFGLRHKFSFPGEIPNIGDALPQMLSTFDVVCYITEKTEAFSLAILEAMAAGLPIITQNAGGMPEQVVHGKTGFLCNSRQEVRYYCELLSNNPQLVEQMGKAAKERAKQFTIERMCKEYDNLFHELISR